MKTNCKICSALSGKTKQAAVQLLHVHRPAECGRDDIDGRQHTNAAYMGTPRSSKNSSSGSSLLLRGLAV